MQLTHAPRLHLQDSELIDRTSACPICLSEAPRRPGFRVQTDPDVTMLACANCHGHSASHMPRPEVLEGYYAQYYAGLDREVTFADASRFARHVVRALPRHAFGRSMRILDYGGGDGSLSKAIAERLLALGRTARVHVVVVDFASREPLVTENITVRVQPPAEPLQDRYELVLASAILEHLPDVRRLLPTLYDAIAPAGFFYARTPWTIPLTKLLPGADLGYPAHVHDMGSHFWNRLPETFSWSVRVLASRPSLVAGGLGKDPLRTLAAVALKCPGYLESFVSPRDRQRRWWPFVGGWEVLFQRV